MKLPKVTAVMKTADSGSQGAHVRKQVYELTLGDLNQFPVWEFRLGEEDKAVEAGRDECTVRPYTASGPLNPVDGMFIVRTTFTLADGTKLQGYCTPPLRGDNSLGTLQPIIVTDRGQVRFWCGTAAPDIKRLAHAYKLLGKDAGRVFPVQFESDVKLVGDPVTGSVPGFLVLVDFQTRKTRAVV
jgi:hypothetical protein